MNSQIDELINELNNTESGSFELNNVDFGNVEDLKKKVITNAADSKSEGNTYLAGLVKDYTEPAAETPNGPTSTGVSKKVIAIIVIALILFLLLPGKVRLIIALVLVAIIAVLLLISSISKKTGDNNKKKEP